MKECKHSCKEETIKLKSENKKLKKERYLAASGEEITVVNAGVMLTKLLQVSAGSIYSDTKEVIELSCARYLKD